MGEAFGEGVDGDDAVEMDEAFFAGFDDLGFGMVDGAGFEEEGFAVDDDFVADFKIILHEGEVPPAEVVARGAVFEDEFEDGAGGFAKAFDAEGDDRAAGQGGLVELQLFDGTEMTAVFVATGAVEEEVFDGADVEAVELPGAFGTDAPE